MVEYRGIEKVGAQALSKQRLLTEALWLTLQRQGVKDKTSGRIECFFVACEDSAVASLLRGFPDAAKWNREVSRIDDPSGGTSVKIISPLVCLSRESLLELVDVMMIAARLVSRTSRLTSARTLQLAQRHIEGATQRFRTSRQGGGVTGNCRRRLLVFWNIRGSERRASVLKVHTKTFRPQAPPRASVGS
jgi:hypothetical protein